ncbi:hypothetical protein FS837_011971 [Tulasnella sp. UAMH 9824]|nr:hypothetical protein FS837_011971 [Tulasnella sp. UAMH 9824]
MSGSRTAKAGSWIARAGFARAKRRLTGSCRIPVRTNSFIRSYTLISHYLRHPKMSDVILSGSTTTTVADDSPFTVNPRRRDALALLPDVLVPPSREPSPGFDERVMCMVDYIERVASKTPKNLPTLLNLLTGDLSGFVVGASSWGEEQTVKQEKDEEEEKERSEDWGFATYDEEAEAREQFEATISAGRADAHPILRPLGHGPSPKKKRKIIKEGRTTAHIEPQNHHLGPEKLPKHDVGHVINPPAPGVLYSEIPRPRTPPAPHDKVSSALQGSPFKPASSLRQPMGEPHPGAAIASSVAGPSRHKPRANYDPNLSEEFYPPSFPSDLMTSTPAPLSRQKPPHIMPIPERPLAFATAAPSPGYPQAARFKANAPIRPVVFSRPVQAFNFAPSNTGNEGSASTCRSSSPVSDPEAEEERAEPKPEPEPISLTQLGRVPTVDDLLNAPAEQRRQERMAARPVKKLPRRSGSGREDDADKWRRERSRAELSEEPSSRFPTQQRSTQRITGLESHEPSLEQPRPANEYLRRRRSSVSSSSTASSHQPRDADGVGVFEGDDVVEVYPQPPASRSSSPSTERPQRKPGSQENPKSAVGALKFNNLAPLSQQASAKSSSARNAAGASDRPGVKDRLSGAMPQSSSSSLGGHAAFQSQFDVERSMNIIGGMLDEDVWP